jgi:release factor glutamine methyltransferase
MTLKGAESRLVEAGISEARLLARRVFSEIGGFRDYELLSGNAECDMPELLSAVERLSRGEPIDYILGYRDFYRERYKVTPSVLIPRSDTEILVDFAVNSIPRGEHFIDLCTGSGCVALSTLKNTERTTATLVDISDEALAVARENAEELGLIERCELLLLDARRNAVSGEPFAVLSNPPYVTDDAYLKLDRNIYYEPRLAFVGGVLGDDFYRDITPLYRDRIKKSGFIAYEIGYDQEELIKKIARENLMSAEILRDLSGNARVAVLKR